MVTAVYLAAGVSSRFGGRIKALVKIGKNNESLLEISMNQAKEAGFEKFVLIVSDKTFEPIKKEFGASFNGIPINYCFQKTPSYRIKPLGTADAVLAAKDLVEGAFIILNSDDLYGKNAIKKVAEYMKNNKDAYCIPGYLLKNVLPDAGTVNRGIIKQKKGDWLSGIKETFKISKQDIPSRFKGNELISMNFFAMQEDFMDFNEKFVDDFIKKYPNDPDKECLLPDSISEFLKKTKKKMKVIPVEDVWLGLTNPEDEELVREKIRNSF